LTYTIQIKKGKLNVEKALEAMDFDVVKFESELKMLADHQPVVMRKKLLGQYVTYMRGCGFKLDIGGIGKTHVSKEEPTPKTEPVAEITPEIPVKPENKPETMYDQVAAEDSALVETQKEEVPVSVPHVDVAPTVELTTEIVAKEQPQKTVKTDSKDSATAYFTYPDANLFKKLFESMCFLVNEMTWKFNKDTLSMRQMDPSRVAMIDLTIKKEDFEEFNVTVPGLVTFSAEEVKKAVFAKPFRKDTSIGVKIDGVIGRITFILKDSGTRERSFPTLEAEQEDVPSPKITFNVKCKIISKQIANDIKDLEKMGDHMKIIGTSDTLQLQTDGEYGVGKNTYQRGDENLLDIEVKEESKSTFSFSYLKNFIQPALSELALLEFATDMPLKVTLLTKFGDLKLYVAPRVESD